MINYDINLSLSLYKPCLLQPCRWTWLCRCWRSGRGGTWRRASWWRTTRPPPSPSTTYTTTSTSAAGAELSTILQEVSHCPEKAPSTFFPCWKHCETSPRFVDSSRQDLAPGQLHRHEGGAGQHHLRGRRGQRGEWSEGAVRDADQVCQGNIWDFIHRRAKFSTESLCHWRLWGWILCADSLGTNSEG